jgi:hypothetical protein
LLRLQDNTVRKIKSIPGLVLSADLQVHFWHLAAYNSTAQQHAWQLANGFAC